MNSDERLDALFHAARATLPDTERAELAFETRLAARLREERGASWLAWSWRLSPFFAALVVASALWCHFSTAIEPEAETLFDAVRNGGQASMLAWWPEEER
jgi:hypothetical protein